MRTSSPVKVVCSILSFDPNWVRNWVESWKIRSWRKIASLIYLLCLGGVDNHHCFCGDFVCEWKRPHLLCSEGEKNEITRVGYFCLSFWTRLWSDCTVLNPQVFFQSIFSIFFSSMEVLGRQNIPTHGPIIFTGNHMNQVIFSAVIGFILSSRFVHFPIPSILLWCESVRGWGSYIGYESAQSGFFGSRKELQYANHRGLREGD